MSQISTITRPYAKAAFNFARENQLVDKWENMLSFIAKIADNQQINELLYSSISPKILAKIFIIICDNQINEHVRNLIRIMAENRRLNILSELIKQFIQLRAVLEKTININVISAIKLNKKQQFKISITLEKRFLSKVKLNYKIDKFLIAGVIIYAGDLVIDGSVRGYIERLTDILQS
ncbi:MAG: F0F1 ATP synthase subunit delta [Arsenophonus sp. ET-DL9-MAG3]